MSNFALETIPTVRRDYFITVWMLIAHGLALLALFHPTSIGVTSFLVLYVVTGCFGITLGFHRLLTHRSMRVPKWLERTFATCGTLALQGSPLEWVAHHRMHHAGSDTERDPHNASRGFWYSHLGWLLHQDPGFDDPTLMRKFARDITADPYLAAISTPVAMIGMQVLLGLILFLIGGWSAVLWGIFLRLVVVYHVTWLVNSAAHSWGYRTYDVPDLATNNWWVGLLAFGEGWHNNHHVYPEGVHVQHKWWELDLTWMFILVLEKIGLATHLKRPDRATVALRQASA